MDVEETSPGSSTGGGLGCFIALVVVTIWGLLATFLR